MRIVDDGQSRRPVWTLILHPIHTQNPPGISVEKGLVPVGVEEQVEVIGGDKGSWSIDDLMAEQ